MYLYKVKDTKRITLDTLLLTLEAKKERDLFNFNPGQYASIGFKYRGRPSPMRCFSIVSAPHQDELQFAMRITGEFTQSLASLTEGETVFVRAPFGEFVIDEKFDRNILMLAGGIGITPFISMLRDAAERRSTSKITLLYSVVSENNIPFFDELRQLEKINPNFRVAFFITGKDVNNMSTGRILSGRIDEERLLRLTGGYFNRYTHFICGPGNFISGMCSILEKHHTEQDRIVTEEFTATGPNSYASASRYSVSKLTYAATGVSLILAAAFIMLLDLARVVPKATSINTNATTTSLTSTQSNSQATNPNGSSSSNTNSAPSQPATPSQTTYIQPTYQPPVTSVS